LHKHRKLLGDVRRNLQLRISQEKSFEIQIGLITKEIRINTPDFFFKNITMKSSAKIMVISGDKKLTKFMQCADVFEASKVLGTLNILSVNYKENEKASLSRAGLLIDAIKNSLEDDEVVSFIHVLEVTNGNTTIRNQGEIVPYINKTVRCISDGHSWFVLSDFIEQKTGLKVVTDKHKFIISVGVQIEPANSKSIEFQSNNKK
jgi:hypothetical protein